MMVTRKTTTTASGFALRMNWIIANSTVRAGARMCGCGRRQREASRRRFTTGRSRPTRARLVAPSSPRSSVFSSTAVIWCSTVKASTERGGPPAR